jgi:hypothetical protein
MEPLILRKRAELTESKIQTLVSAITTLFVIEIHPLNEEIESLLPFLTTIKTIKTSNFIVIL